MSDVKFDFIQENSTNLDCITVHPGLLQGQITLPISKSLAHRLILAKALSIITLNDPKISSIDSFIKLDNLADDVIRTLTGANTLVYNIEKCDSNQCNCKIYCNDSGTTLRMILPIACTLYNLVEITVTNELAKRPMAPLIDVLKDGGCEINIVDNKNGTFTYRSHGKFQGGPCQIAGNISSQYISGLLYALPLTKNGGKIHLTTTISSKPYLDMTLAILKDFGIDIEINRHPNLDTLVFHVKGRQQFKNISLDFTQGDWSAAAFFIVANRLGSKVKMTNLDFNSIQGDKIIHTFIDTIEKNLHPVINLENYPDLFPILAVFAAYQKKTTTFTGVNRLRLKESDRIASTSAMLQALHVNCSVYDNNVMIHGTGKLTGGIVNSFKDHRIAMASAIAATMADGPITILGSSCCDKSYPGFFQDYVNLGGKIG